MENTSHLEQFVKSYVFYLNQPSTLFISLVISKSSVIVQVVILIAKIERNVFSIPLCFKVIFVDSVNVMDKT